MYSAHLGFALVQIEEAEEGLAHLKAAISSAETTREGYAEAELHRLLGKALHHVGDAKGAEREFHVALAISRRQQARWWELCAAMDLARLWRDRGCRNEARDLLAPVYNWFTEGFDAAGLKEAKALLDELA